MNSYSMVLLQGSEGSGIQVKAETDTIYTTAGKEIATAQPAWLSDVLLLQGTVYANTEIENLKSAFKRNLTTLSTELKRHPA